MFDFSPNTLAHSAMTALKKAYEDCSDMAAKDSIMTAFKAVIQLHHELGKLNDSNTLSEDDSDYDPSDYCSAV